MKTRTKIPTLLWLLILIGFTALAMAQEPTLKSDLFELYLHPDSKVVSRFDNGWETKMVVEHEGERVRVKWSDEEALFLFPTSTLRLKSEALGSERTVTAFLNGDKYEVKDSSREVSWRLPGQDVFFQKRGGKITQAVGSSDFLKLIRDTPSGRLTLQSSAGLTDALINNKGKLETFDGPAIEDHIYMVRGLSFQKGPVDLRIPLPSGPFLEGLPENHYLTIQDEIVPIPKPAARTEPEEKSDPLQAEPATWDSPELRARSGDSAEDPLNVRKENRVKHPEDPLKAKTSKDSEEVLRAKDY